MISVTHELLGKVDAAAKDSGVSRSKWLRQVALDALSPVEQPEDVVPVPVEEPLVEEPQVALPPRPIPPGVYLRQPPNHRGHSKKAGSSGVLMCLDCGTVVR